MVGEKKYLVGTNDRNPVYEVMRDGDEIAEETLAQVPMGRHCTVDEIVDAVEFLVSDKATFITGEILNVAGGFHVRT